MQIGGGKGWPQGGALFHALIRHSASSARRLTHSSTDFFFVPFVIFVVQIARALGGGVEIIAGVSP